MRRHCENTLCGILKCRANSTTTAVIAVRQVKPFEVGRDRAMLREEDNILSNPVSGTQCHGQRGGGGRNNAKCYKMKWPDVSGQSRVEKVPCIPNLNKLFPVVPNCTYK
ncbi:hypothetical protein AVEN_16428-1 [Araneus ventricosus]|uniref:Uncharacterized protein n=1 Tax=Araneus ventricosus TaxID=182803 RepID=A0A4Y2HSI6_ARAVE|nr:hypothetical protein AVEN_16428-1 [Araneus ventricosus]